MKSKYLLYKDTFITIFSDDEKYIVVFLTDNAQAKAIGYDTNFFYEEMLIDTYLEMIIKSFKGWNDNEILERDWVEIKEHLEKFVKYLTKQTEIDFDLIGEEARKVLGL